MYAKISILGMYNYDNTIFDDLELPEGIARDTLLQQIIFDNASLSLYITDPDTLKTAIGFWSRSQTVNWERLALALTEEYNPLHNYDRHEEWTDENEGGESTSGQETSTGRSSGSSSGSGNNTTTGNETLSKAGYNHDNGLAQAEKTDSTASTATSDQASTTTEGSSSVTRTESGSHTNSSSHSGHVYGNIGVTTSAQMIAGEIDVRTRYNIYQMISDDFKQKFCIMVY